MYLFFSIQLKGFTGKNCESELTRCDDGLCGHQGICWLHHGDEAVCYCSPDYHGTRCQVGCCRRRNYKMCKIQLADELKTDLVFNM